MPDGSTDGSHTGVMLAQISTELVRLHARHYGKGPTKAKTHLADDMIICVLRGGFTAIERTLIEAGDFGPVHRMRRDFQRAMETEFTAAVERATGRQVTAYMSLVHIEPD